MELVVSWIAMAVILFLGSNMIDVIIALVPFIAPFLYTNVVCEHDKCTYGNGMYVVEGFVVQPWLICSMFVAFVPIFT
jgi:hypothetical protein